MSRHEGVSCDSCLKGNFKGRRFKCLICYDYDLCHTCYDAGVSTPRHTANHPMQCILTKADQDLYFSGDNFGLGSSQGGGGLSLQSFTCPLCSKLGFTQSSLYAHINSCPNASSSHEVVCPICASLPGGDPNKVTDDFAGHLMEHQEGGGLELGGGGGHSSGAGGPPGSRDLINFLDSSGASVMSGGVGLNSNPARSLGVRRAPSSGRTVGGSTRSRRSANLHSALQSNVGVGGAGGASGGIPAHHAAGGQSTLHEIIDVPGFSSAQEIDPIAELLSQLSGVRRSTASSSRGGGGSSHLHQLQMQLQAERQQVQQQQQQSSRNMPGPSGSLRSRSMYPPNSAGAAASHPHPIEAVNRQGNVERSNARSAPVNNIALALGKQYLLRQLSDEEHALDASVSEDSAESRRSEARKKFVQDIVLSTLVVRD